MTPHTATTFALELGIRARRSAERALRAANTLQEATERIAHVRRFDGVSVSATASIGIALYSPEVPAPAGLLKQADQALYQAKQQGRDRYCFHSPETDEALPAQLVASMT